MNMELKQRLDQRQVQKLILAPALQQAIKLLPLTNLELLEIIDAEVSQNPMIEIEEETAEKPAAAEREGEEEPKPDRGPLESLAHKEDDTGNAAESEDPNFEAHFQEYLDDGFRPHFQEPREAVSLENTLTRAPSLWDHLNWQASLTFHGQEDREIAQFVIGNINEDGYLTAPVAELADLCRSTPEKVEAVRAVIQRFDPVGSASLDLREALLAQMDYRGIDDPVARAILDRHLDLLEKSDYVQLARVLNIPLADVKVHLEVIRSLDPTPGRKHSAEKTAYVVPDIVVTREEDEWKVTLNDEGLPRLRLSLYYRALLAKAARDNPEAYRFLKDRMKKALWFLRSLDQRNQTIYRVARYIVDKQKDFFEKGIDYIKPLTLMEIAQEIGVHESTVGRVVTNKHLLTSSGVFALKYFFHKSLPGDYGEEVSSLKIKQKIRRIVEGEDPARPLSDIEIGGILARENLKIARRTVTKYRKQLDIQPSHIRKRKSLMEAS